MQVLWRFFAPMPAHSGASLHQCQLTGKQTGALCYRCEQTRPTRTHCHRCKQTRTRPLSPMRADSHRCEQTRTDASRLGVQCLTDIALASGARHHPPPRTHLALPSPLTPSHPAALTPRCPHRRRLPSSSLLFPPPPPSYTSYSSSSRLLLLSYRVDAAVARSGCHGA